MSEYFIGQTLQVLFKNLWFECNIPETRRIADDISLFEKGDMTVENYGSAFCPAFIHYQQGPLQTACYSVCKVCKLDTYRPQEQTAFRKGYIIMDL